MLFPPLFLCPSPYATRMVITIKSPLSLDSLGPLESSPRHWTCWIFPANPDVPVSLAEILDVNSPQDLPFQPHRLLRDGLKGGSPMMEAPEVTFSSHSGWRDCWLAAWALWQQEPEKQSGDIHIQLPSEITHLTERVYKEEFIRHITLFF